MQKSTYKIPILIIIITLIGSVIVAFSIKSSWDTWVYQKSIYTDLIKLVGEISANRENIEELKSLKFEFDRYYGGEMIFAEANDKELLHRMMVLNKDYENHILGKTDYYRPEKLNQSCLKLIKQLTLTINSKESQYLLKLLIPLFIGSLLLILYFASKILLKKNKRKILNEKLPQAKINEIKELIGNGNTSKALEVLKINLSEKEFAKIDELVMLKAQFKNAQNDLNLDLIDSSEKRSVTARINKGIIDFLNNLNEEY